jgi:hypothetical protein
MDVILNNLTSMFIFKESWTLVLEYALPAIPAIQGWVELGF